MENNSFTPLVDFGQPEDKSKNIIKVIGVGGGGCNAVRNMYKEGIVNVTFAVCNTDSQSLAKSPVPVKIQLGKSGLGAGANPEKGREEAEQNIDDIKRLLDDGTKMAFITAGMGGGTGTGAAPIIAGIAKEKGILTIGIVTIPFYFEKKRKIIKALKGVEEMRKNVDALLIINNERLCDIFSDTQVTIKEAFHRADEILCNAAKSISELITVGGDINLDFRDIETTMRGGGGAIMAMGRAKGEHRVEKAIINALDSPLLYGSDISKAKKILFNIYTGEKNPLFVSEMQEIDAFMDELNPDIDVIWGISDDNSLGEDAKVTILATGFEDRLIDEMPLKEHDDNDTDYFDKIIKKLYFQKDTIVNNNEEHNCENDDANITFTVSVGVEENEDDTNEDTQNTYTKLETETPIINDIENHTAHTTDAEQGLAIAQNSAADIEQTKYDMTADQSDEIHDNQDTRKPQQQEPAPPEKRRPLTFVEKVKKRMEQFAFDITQDDDHK